MSFDDEERQYSFTLRPGLEKIWMRIKDAPLYRDAYLTLSDFNTLLSRIGRCGEEYESVVMDMLEDCDLLTGEVILLTALLGGNEVQYRLVKMNSCQYLDFKTGQGLAFGSQVVFSAGQGLTDSEGHELGGIVKVELLSPTRLHIALSQVFMSRYFRHEVAGSLWPLYERVCEFVESGEDNCDSLLSEASDCGIGILPMLYIINAAVGRKFS